MITCIIAAATLLQKPITVPAFSSFDGKSWAGMTLGVSERDLKKQVSASKTVIADPASIRIATDRKNWVLTALLSDVNQRGVLVGFALESERDEPLVSVDALRQDLGEPDYFAYPRIRFSDWSLAIWKAKGIAVVLRGGDRPVGYKVLLTAPDTLGRTADLLDRKSTEIRLTPRIGVGGFSTFASSDPDNSSLNSACRDFLRSALNREISEGDHAGWFPDRSSSTRIQVSVRVRKKKEITVETSISLTARDELGDVSVSDSSTSTVPSDIETGFRVASQLDDLLAKLPRMIEDKYRPLVWRAEWRPFYGLAKP